MDTLQEMDERLWDFIDGRCSDQDRVLIGNRVADDPVWKSRYQELIRLNDELHQQELEAPSLRFTRNVMDQIARFQVSPASSKYINRNVIRGIMAFFLVPMVAVVIYLIATTSWTGSSSDSFLSSHHLNPENLNWVKSLRSLPVNVLVLVNVILGLFLLDKYLQQKKN